MRRPWHARHSAESVLAQRVLLRRDTHQRRIELHEGRIHRAVLPMTAVAGRGCRNRFRRRAAHGIEEEEPPSSREPLRVLQVDFDVRRVTGLELAASVDGALLRGCATLLHELGPVRPGARPKE